MITWGFVCSVIKYDMYYVFFFILQLYEMDKEIRAKLENERQKEQEKIIQGKLLLISRYIFLISRTIF